MRVHVSMFRESQFQTGQKGVEVMLPVASENGGMSTDYVHMIVPERAVKRNEKREIVSVAGLEVGKSYEFDFHEFRPVEPPKAD